MPFIRLMKKSELVVVYLNERSFVVVVVVTVSEGSVGILLRGS